MSKIYMEHIFQTNACKLRQIYHLQGIKLTQKATFKKQRLFYNPGLKTEFHKFTQNNTWFCKTVCLSNILAQHSIFLHGYICHIRDILQLLEGWVSQFQDDLDDQDVDDYKSIGRINNWVAHTLVAEMHQQHKKWPWKQCNIIITIMKIVMPINHTMKVEYE